MASVLIILATTLHSFEVLRKLIIGGVKKQRMDYYFYHFH